jgi:hypothetical protein
MAEWVEIDGVRLPDTAMIFSVEHKVDVNKLPEVTIRMHCGGFETVAIEDTKPSEGRTP